MSSRRPEKMSAEGDAIGVRFTIRRMIVVIAVIGVALGIVVQAPSLVVDGLGIALMSYAFYKVVRIPSRSRSLVGILIAFVILGMIIGFLV